MLQQSSHSHLFARGWYSRASYIIDRSRPTIETAEERGNPRDRIARAIRVGSAPGVGLAFGGVAAAALSVTERGAHAAARTTTAERASESSPPRRFQCWRSVRRTITTTTTAAVVVKVTGHLCSDSVHTVVTGATSPPSWPAKVSWNVLAPNCRSASTDWLCGRPTNRRRRLPAAVVTRPAQPVRRPGPREPVPASWNGSPTCYAVVVPVVAAVVVLFPEAPVPAASSTRGFGAGRLSATAWPRTGSSGRSRGRRWCATNSSSTVSLRASLPRSACLWLACASGGATCCTDRQSSGTTCGRWFAANSLGHTTTRIRQLYSSLSWPERWQPSPFTAPRTRTQSSLSTRTRFPTKTYWRCACSRPASPTGDWNRF